MVVVVTGTDVSGPSEMGHGVADLRAVDYAEHSLKTTGKRGVLLPVVIILLLLFWNKIHFA